MANVIQAPLPGTVLDVKVAAGDKVSAFDVVLILEAMKMENEISCEEDGTVKEVLVKVGDVVTPGQDMVTFE